MSDGDSSNVTALHLPPSEVLAAWVDYDRAMLDLHAMYGRGEPNQAVRFRAAAEVLIAEKTWRRAYARWQPGTVITHEFE